MPEQLAHKPVPVAPPRCDLRAEAAVLSAMLLSEDAALECVELLSPPDFFADANRRIFDAAREVLAEGAHLDVVAVLAKLRLSGRLEQVGGSPYLASIADATPAVAHVADHARIIRDLARLRRAGDLFSALASEAKNADIEDVSAWLESCESRAYQATSDRGDGKPTASDYTELAREAYKEVAEAAQKGRQMLGRTTGFRVLDEHLGGLEAGDLIVLAGRPGHGKTALAVQIAENVAKDASEPAAAIVLSQEMLRVRLMLRSFARHAGETLRQLRTGQPSSWSNLQRAVQGLAGMPIIIDDEKRLTPLKVRAKARRHYNTIRAKNPGIPLGLIVIDYVQLMQADFHERGETRASEIGRITRELKITAGEFGCAVLLLSQLRRADKSRAKSGQTPRPTLEDLRDSGSIEADADVVLALHREDEHRAPGEQTDGIAELLALKGRNSGRGAHELHFDGARTAFFERDHLSAQNDIDYGSEYEERYP